VLLMNSDVLILIVWCVRLLIRVCELLGLYLVILYTMWN